MPISLPTRASVSEKLKTTGKLLGTLASIAGIVSIYPIFFTSEKYDTKIIGRWESDYSYPMTNGTFKFHGTTNYLHEGKYNVTGTITLEGVENNKPYTFVYNAIGAGNWSTDHDRLSITLNSLKSTTKSLTLDSVKIPPELVEKISGQPLPTLSDAYPQGLSDEFKIKSTDASKITLTAKDPFGRYFAIEMHRQQ